MKPLCHCRARNALMVALAVAGCMGAPAGAKEQKIRCEAVPAAVRAAFEQAYPKANIKACAKEALKRRRFPKAGRIRTIWP
jgi:hypothetical protein